MHTYTLYNILLDHPSLNALGVVVLTTHLAMKFSSNNETIIIVQFNQRTTRECYMASLRLRLHAKEEAPKVVHYVLAKMETE